MTELRKRFGRLLAGHRRRIGLTQEELAEAAEVSVDMISKLESGTSGARFSLVQRLADALDVDPAELFTTQTPAIAVRRGPFQHITARLAQLDDADLEWLGRVLDAILGTAVRPRPPKATHHMREAPRKSARRR